MDNINPLTMVTDDDDFEPVSSNFGEGEEIPDEIVVGEVKLTPGETFYYTVWGVRYRFKGGNWTISEMSFRKKSDIEDWTKEYLIMRHEGMETEVIPVKRCLLMNEMGIVKTWTEELS